MNNNTLIIGLIFGLIFAPGFVAIELKILAFFAKLIKLNVKLNKPVEVIALIASELITIILSLTATLTTPTIYSFIVLLFLSLRIFGLWKLKKWVLYIYLTIIILPLFNGGLFGALGINNLILNIVTLISQCLVLLVYYLYVYKPNKELFK